MSRALPLVRTSLEADYAAARQSFTGYRGKYAVDLAIDNAVTVSAAAHPAGVAVPADLDSLLAKSTVPLLIKACETDRTVSFSTLISLPSDATAASCLVRPLRPKLPLRNLADHTFRLHSGLKSPRTRQPLRLYPTLQVSNRTTMLAPLTVSQYAPT